MWGQAGGPEGPAGARQIRAEAHESMRDVDEDTLRIAQEMRDAGLKYRPPILTPMVLWVIALIVVVAIVTYFV